MSRLLQANRLAEARALGARLAAANPGNAEVLSMLGSVHGILGEFKEAENCYRTLVSLQPRSFQHHCYLGLSLVMQGRLAEAASPFETMLQLRPDFAEGHMHMGCLQRDLGNHDRAIEHLRHTLRLSPSLHDAAVFLANILTYRGRLNEALELYDQVLAKMPGYSEALAGKASALEQQGNLGAAWECLAPAIARHAVTPSVAIIYAKLAPKLDRTDHARSLLHDVLSDAAWAPSQRQEMHFALGTLDDKTGNYDEAFTHFHSANLLSPYTYNTAEKGRAAKRIVDFFTTVDLPSAHPAPDGMPTPIFIVGMPRSGTSLVEQILAAHPDVAAAGELEALPNLEYSAAGILGRPQSYPECLRGASVSEMTTLANTYMDVIAAIAGGARYVTDKLPPNYERLGLISKLFPNARILHTIRDPRDTCLSCYFQNFSRTHTYSSSLRMLGEVYRIYEWQMASWRETLSIDILDIEYEALVHDTERGVRRILEFCHLPWNPRCLEFHKSKRQVNTASYDQVRQPIYRKSVARWKNYESHVGELLDALSQLPKLD